MEVNSQVVGHTVAVLLVVRVYAACERTVILLYAPITKTLYVLPVVLDSLGCFQLNFLSGSALFR